MTTLDGYQHFNGKHHETGSIHNIMDFLGVKNPHTGDPISEAMLLGLGGGITAMYFAFDYEDEDPSLYIGTRYPFDPIETILNRAGVEATVVKTTSAQKAESNLCKALKSGHPALVWADHLSMPYNGEEPGEYGAMRSMVVYGCDKTEDTIYIADRSMKPLIADRQTLTGARGRQGSLKYKLIHFDPPTINDLAPSITEGIMTCIGLYLEKPPKGPKNNFGLAAFTKWMGLLSDKSKRGWAKMFPPGRLLYSALLRVSEFSEDGASRPMYADFLDEAAEVLGKPDLKIVGEQFREAGQLWDRLAEAALPDSVPTFSEARGIITENHRLFREQGMDAADTLRENNRRLKTIELSMESGFPLSNAETKTLRESLAEHIEAIHNTEKSAVEMLRDVAA